jgi:DNA-binding Lrp family transcriptional regulator
MFGNENISRIKLELILFFKENPGAIDRAEVIASRLGREAEEVRKNLEELVESGICKRFSELVGEQTYIYAPSCQLLERVSELAPEMKFSSRIELVNTLLRRKNQLL